MTRQELEKKLRSLGIHDDAYKLDGGLPNECYVLAKQTDGKWEVYYSERGLRSGSKEFDSESEACEELLEWLIRDLST